MARFAPTARLAAGALPTAGLLLVLATPALATNASLSGSTLHVEAGLAQQNIITVARSSTQFTITEDLPNGPKMNAGAGCQEVVKNEKVTCPSGSVTAIEVQLKDGDDHVSVDAGAAGVIADGGEGEDSIQIHGTGDDTLSGGLGPDHLEGDGGNDTLDAGPSGITKKDELDGGAGDDVLNGGLGDDDMAGGPGNDTLNGGPNADVMEGGSGGDVFIGGLGAADKVSYAGHNGVKVTFNGAADDGAPGEGDNVGDDVEFVDGSPGDDELTGNNGPNQLNGKGGNDKLLGLGGNDGLLDQEGSNTLDGGPGDDFVGSQGSVGSNALTGGPGDDQMLGGNGNDTLDGGDGNDSLNGGLGQDALSAGLGADEIAAKDGQPDQVSCGIGGIGAAGDGGDHAVVDLQDALAPNCEKVDSAPVRERLAIRIDRVDVQARRAVVRLRCRPRHHTCRGTVALAVVTPAGDEAAVGTRRFRVRARHVRTLRVRIPSAARALLGSSSDALLRATATERGGKGRRTTTVATRV